MTHSNNSTGRIHQHLTPGARRILYGRLNWDDVKDDLLNQTHVDQAHVLMLIDCGLIARDKGVKLLQTIRSLRGAEFEPLQDRPSYRGLYLLYEEYVREIAGSDIGGLLHMGRSRNDLNATLSLMKMRSQIGAIGSSLLRLQCVLIHRSEKFLSCLMPAYTHGQVAEPTTFGHYLSGLAQAIDRDLAEVLRCARGLQTSPLGAGAIVGTSLGINSALTAELLGFDSTFTHAIDAIATRDYAFRILSTLAILGTGLSRMATDLLTWSSIEFGFIEFPDELVGSSSAMPQKRNPFLLEHIQGRCSSALAAFVHALAASKNTPFSNSIGVNTESLRPFSAAVQDTQDAIDLLRFCLSGVSANSTRMHRRIDEGFGNATALANELQSLHGVDFRTAHRIAGEMVNKAIRNSYPTLQAMCEKEHPEINLRHLDPAYIVENGCNRGGTSSAAVKAHLEILKSSWRENRRILRELKAVWSSAVKELEQTVDRAIKAST